MQPGFDQDPPTVVSIRADVAGSSNATTFIEIVTFSESVTGVDINDFFVTTSGTASAHIASVTPVGTEGTTYAVQLDQISGDGTIRLDLIRSTDIQDSAGNTAVNYTGGTSTTVDHTAPNITLALSAGTGAGINHLLPIDPRTGAQVLNTANFAQAFRLGGTASDNDLTSPGGAVVVFRDMDDQRVFAHAVPFKSDGSGGYYYAFRIDSTDTTNGINHDLSALLTDGTYTVQAATQDTAGNISLTAPQALIVDTTADFGRDLAIAVDKTADGILNASESRKVYFNLSGLDADAEAIVTFSDGALTQSAIVKSNTVICVDLTRFNGDVATLLSVVDSQGNTTLISGDIFSVDGLVPIVTGVSYGANDGNLSVGERVTFSLALSEAVTVTNGAAMNLHLNTGGLAIFNAGASDATHLVYDYTVLNRQSTADLAVTNFEFNGGRVLDAAGNKLDLSAALTNPAGILAVDGTAYEGHPDATDTFAFKAGFGAATIRGFIAGSGENHDVLQFPHGFFTNDDWSGGAQDAAGDVILTSSSGHDSVRLDNAHKAMLAQADFHFI